MILKVKFYFFLKLRCIFKIVMNVFFINVIKIEFWILELLTLFFNDNFFVLNVGIGFCKFLEIRYFKVESLKFVGGV